ncbi:uncharacterized protein EV422DRAFT_567225 [Fimicolochytrium jonesii]|uniref:uncharacterized protein n=1 Tax=Fimicolochytrium jonesii TaxID=1396493 RepID=UPI0022FE92F3|nr:uncharacterized protein EV422DRAFT_567225 [Fimicolochytrium jonesii]KAI8821491.1 hypothetical protein EV422DRAFT_567225 [Fimicolochytrium jonesii]
MGSTGYYIESLRDASSNDKEDMNMGTEQQGGNLSIPGGRAPGAYGRPRAETFSFFPSKMVSDPAQMSTPSRTAKSAAPMSIRNRSGSLSLPRSNISGAFGPSLFATSWQPASILATLGERTLVGHSDYASSAGGEDETTAVARTLDYLGLDDPVLDGSRNGYVGRDIGNTVSSFNRARSYSVAVGEKMLLPSAMAAASSGYRPRATSIAFMETTVDSDIEAIRRSLARGDLELEMESPASDLNVDGALYNIGHSPQDYAPYGIDRALSESPLRQNVDLPHAHQVPTRSLWIGNIDPTLSPSDLLTLFSPFGPIESLRILPDKECAFVNYVRMEDAVAARDEMQGGRVGNCVVRIGYGKAEAINDTQGMQPTKSLWVGNIAPSMDPAELEAMFAVFGPVESARVLTHKNCGFVNFVRLEDAMEARRRMNGNDVGGAVIKIGYAKVPPKGSEPLGFGPSSATHIFHGTSPTRDRPNSSAGRMPSYQPAPGYVLGTTLQQNYASNRNSTGNHSVSSAQGYPHDVRHSSTSPLSGRFSTAGQNGNGAYLKDSSVTLGSRSPVRKNSVGGEEALDSLWKDVASSETYAQAIPPVPEPKANRRVDQMRLRELRKRLEGHPSVKDVESYFNEVVDDTVDLCTDYIGNVVIQKLIEKTSDAHRLRLIEAIAPHMPAIGIHKNGTWVVQKIIDYAKTGAQIEAIVNALKAFTPPLLLDQFGNYVVQCCLPLGTLRNQFVFNAMHAKCIEIGQGRFGARAMRACLESQFTTKRQQKFVAEAIVHNVIQLVTNPNGAILVTWLLDASGLPGRYSAMAPKLAMHIIALCTHKLASATILKLVTQRVEPEAREHVVQEIFYREDPGSPHPSNLQQILSDQIHGVSVIQKILASGCTSADEKTRFADCVRNVLATMPEVRESQMGYKRLLDELMVIPSNLPPDAGVAANLGRAAGGAAGYSVKTYNVSRPQDDEVVSPLVPQTGGGGYPFGQVAPSASTATSSNGHGHHQQHHHHHPAPSTPSHGWYSSPSQLPTPSNSPQPGMYGMPLSPYGNIYGGGPFQQPFGGGPAYMNSYPPSPAHPSTHQQHFGIIPHPMQMNGEMPPPPPSQPRFYSSPSQHQHQQHQTHPGSPAPADLSAGDSEHLDM